MRLFIAIPIAASVRTNLVALQERLKTADPDTEVRWSEPDKFHLTVTFLGDLPDSHLSEVESICTEMAASSSFPLRVRGAGAFPKRGAPKTLWVGVTEGAESWKALVKSGEERFAALGVAREGGLVAHITLGRVRSEGNIALLQAAVKAESTTDCGQQTADRIVLIQSFLDPTGAIYQELGAWKLSGGALTVP